MKDALSNASEWFPTSDKIIATSGAAVAAALSVADLNTWISAVVGLCTIAVLIPRALIGIDDWRQRRRHYRERGFLLCDQRKEDDGE